MNVTGLGAALAVEARKTAASRVVRTTAILLVAGIAVLSGSMTLAAEAGNEQVLAQLGPLADERGWLRLIGTASQICAAGGVLAFGVVLSWSVGREFVEGTITGLFAVPVSRPSIALAKLMVLLGWFIGFAAAVAGVVTALGVALGLGLPDGDATAALGRLLVLGVLTGLIASPAAWAATLGRGLLPRIAAAIGVVVVGQVSGGRNRRLAPHRGARPVGHVSGRRDGRTARPRPCRASDLLAAQPPRLGKAPARPLKDSPGAPLPLRSE